MTRTKHSLRLAAGLVGLALASTACQSIDTDGATGRSMADVVDPFAFLDLAFET